VSVDDLHRHHPDTCLIDSTVMHSSSASRSAQLQFVENSIHTDELKYLSTGLSISPRFLAASSGNSDPLRWVITSAGFARIHRDGMCIALRPESIAHGV